MSASSSPARVRFAPSPTGFLHIGSLRTALYNWFLARRTGGTFILRLEDTDRVRMVEGAKEKMIRSLAICGLTVDEGMGLDADGALIEKGAHGPYLQSECRERHVRYAHDLIARDAAYYCFCSEEDLKKMAEEQTLTKRPQMYDRRCRALAKETAEARIAAGEPHVIRLKVPTEGTCRMHDLIRGEIDIPWAQVDDQVIIKSDGFPTYHLAATCDDHDMQITHVIRGDEWIASLPKHLFIAQAFGWTAPQYAHVPLLLNADRSKLSKRQGDVAVEDYLDKGFLPEAIVNFVALLGWNPTSDREIFSKEELANLFEIEKVNKSAAVCNFEKLEWMNGLYLRALPEETYLAMTRPVLAPLISDVAQQDRAANLFRDRATRVQLLPDLVRPWLSAPKQEAMQIVWKTQTPVEARERLQGVANLLRSLSEDVCADIPSLEARVKSWIAEHGWGNGEVLWPLRVSLSGAKQSPSPFELIYLLGKTESLRRIDEALAVLA